MKVAFVSKCIYSPQCGEKNIRWIHDGCDGSFYIDEDGFLECKECRTRFSIFNAQFNCSRQSIRQNYGRRTKISDILNLIKSLLENCDEKIFCTKLLKSVSMVSIMEDE